MSLHQRPRGNWAAELDVAPHSHTVISRGIQIIPKAEPWLIFFSPLLRSAKPILISQLRSSNWKVKFRFFLVDNKLIIYPTKPWGNQLILSICQEKLAYNSALSQLASWFKGYWEWAIKAWCCQRHLCITQTDCFMQSTSRKDWSELSPPQIICSCHKTLD